MLYRCFFFKKYIYLYIENTGAFSRAYLENKSFSFQILIMRENYILCFGIVAGGFNFPSIVKLGEPKTCYVHE
jgi:hypothetical protein